VEGLGLGSGGGFRVSFWLEFASSDFLWCAFCAVALFLVESPTSIRGLI